MIVYRVIFREFDSEGKLSRLPTTDLFRGSVEEERQGYSFNTEDAFINNIDNSREDRAEIEGEPGIGTRPTNW